MKEIKMIITIIEPVDDDSGTLLRQKIVHLGPEDLGVGQMRTAASEVMIQCRHILSTHGFEMPGMSKVDKTGLEIVWIMPASILGVRFKSL